MDDQPIWISKCITRNDLPWNKSRENSFDRFYGKYTLQDSYWIGIFHNIALDNSITLAIQWDGDCLAEDLKNSLSNPDDWLYLFIKITGVKEVLNFGFKKTKTIKRGIQRSITELELMSADKKQMIIISDGDGGKVKIIYNGVGSFLVLDEDKNIITV
jgi:hypothetical protein